MTRPRARLRTRRGPFERCANPAALRPERRLRLRGVIQNETRADARIVRPLSPGDLAARQRPPRPHEVARVPVRNPFEIVLVLRLRLPEVPGRHHLRHHLARPETRRVDVGDRVERDATLLVGRREDRRAIARPAVVALPRSPTDRTRSRSPRRGRRGCDRSRSRRGRRCSRHGSTGRPASCGSGPACPRSSHRRGLRVVRSWKCSVWWECVLDSTSASALPGRSAHAIGRRPSRPDRRAAVKVTVERRS